MRELRKKDGNIGRGLLYLKSLSSDPRGDHPLHRGPEDSGSRAATSHPGQGARCASFRGGGAPLALQPGGEKEVPWVQEA